MHLKLERYSLQKQYTLATYNAQARTMACKFDGMGARVKDVERAFALVEASQPKVLELGCGSGRDAAEIVRRTPHYLGIDASAGMVRVASEQVPEGVFRRADQDYFCFPSGLDVIFSFASLLHSDRETVERILVRADKALVRGGIFYLSLKWEEEYRGLKVSDQFGDRYFYFYSPELISELAGERWETVEVDYQDRSGQRWFTQVLRKK